jgi:ABC-type multidrug transport system ATPase subunit
MHELSKGTRQKVLIIKTLLSKADVYLFDEPLSGLDLKSRYTFMALVKTLQEQGKIVIIASHFYDDYKFSNKKVIEFS